jgi:NADPH:quinone reductase-like Zn-dependent oxidoreductase
LTAEVPAVPATMPAIVQDAFGGDPEAVLRVGELPVPPIGDDEVLVRVHAASVGMDTWHVMSGRPLAMRIAGFGVRRPKLRNPGRSLAGTVVAAGAKVTAFTSGTEVFGIGDATFAEYAVARAAKLAPKPANITFAEAAGVPISGLAALHAVRSARLEAGQHVAITGAAGGVGSFATQIAKANGAEITAVVSTGKIDAARALGADHVVDYTRDDFTDGSRHYDVILDIAGHRRLRDLRRALTPTGTLVIVGGEGDGKLLGGSDRQLRAALLSPFVRQRLGSFLPTEKGEDLEELRGLIEARRVTPAVGRTYPLTETAAALRAVLDGQVRGKAVVTIAEDGA